MSEILALKGECSNATVYNYIRMVDVVSNAFTCEPVNHYLDRHAKVKVIHGVPGLGVNYKCEVTVENQLNRDGALVVERATIVVTVANRDIASSVATLSYIDIDTGIIIDSTEVDLFQNEYTSDTNTVRRVCNQQIRSLVTLALGNIQWANHLGFPDTGA